MKGRTYSQFSTPRLLLSVAVSIILGDTVVEARRGAFLSTQGTLKIAVSSNRGGNTERDELGSPLHAIDAGPDTLDGAPQLGDALGTGSKEGFGSVVSAVLANLPNLPKHFTTSGSGCVMSGNCVHTRNFPANYGDDESCTITAASAGKLLVPDGFSTESGYDKLTIPGQDASPYMGSSSPAGVVVSQGTQLTWSSDSSNERSGFKLCLETASGSTTSYTHYTDHGSYVTKLEPKVKVGASLSGCGVSWTSLEGCAATAVAAGHIPGDTLRFVQKAGGTCYCYGPGASNGNAGSENYGIYPPGTNFTNSGEASENCYPMILPDGATEFGSCSSCTLLDGLSFVPGYGPKDSAMSVYAVSGHAVDMDTGCGACPDGMHPGALAKVSAYYPESANEVVDAHGARVDDVIICKLDGAAIENWLNCFPLYSHQMYAGDKPTICVKVGEVRLNNLYDSGGLYPDGSGPGVVCSSCDKERWIIRCSVWKIVTCTGDTCYSAKRVTFKSATCDPPGTCKPWETSALAQYKGGVCQGAAASA